MGLLFYRVGVNFAAFSKNSWRNLLVALLTKFKSQFKRGFTKVVVTRDFRLRELSQGELRLYFITSESLIFT